MLRIRDVNKSAMNSWNTPSSYVIPYFPKKQTNKPIKQYNKMEQCFSYTKERNYTSFKMASNFII